MLSQHMYWYDFVTSKGAVCTVEKKPMAPKPFDETTVEDCAVLFKSKAKKGYTIRVVNQDCGNEP